MFFPQNQCFDQWFFVYIVQVWPMLIQIVKALFLFRAPWQRTFCLGLLLGLSGFFYAGPAEKEQFTRPLNRN